MPSKITLNELKIMACLTRGRLYGLEIIDMTNGEVSIGSLYNMLDRLEKKRYVKSEWGEETAERGGNRRRYYELTAAGRQTYAAEFGSIAQLHHGVSHA